MVFGLSELRIKLDQMTESIVSGLKHRSRFLLNEGVFTKEFSGGKSWFLYRLKAEQDVDSEFGRFLYFDQHPMVFGKEQLSPPKLARKIPEIGIKEVRIDLSDEIIAAYREVLKEICGRGEEEEHYGEIAKLDVENILVFNERILGLGEQVAEYKMEKDKKIQKLGSKEELKKRLVVLEREKEVVSGAVGIAKRYEIKNPQAVGKFMQKIIDLTTRAEIEYILKARKAK